MNTLTSRKPSALVRSPFQSLFPRTTLGELFEQFVSNGNDEIGEMMNAAMDVAETDQAFEVTIDLPGISAEDVDIQIDNNTLTVRGERSEDKEEKDEKRKYHRVERYSGSFSRSLLLPSAVNEDETAAEFKDGVLKVTIPKSESAKPRKIEIKK